MYRGYYENVFRKFFLWNYERTLLFQYSVGYYSLVPGRV